MDKDKDKQNPVLAQALEYYVIIKKWMNPTKAAVIGLSLLLFIMFCVIISQSNSLANKSQHLDNLNRNLSTVNDELNKTKSELKSKDEKAKDFMQQEDARKAMKDAIDKKIKKELQKLKGDKQIIDESFSVINTIKKSLFKIVKEFNEIHIKFDNTDESLNKENALIEEFAQKKTELIEKYKDYIHLIFQYNDKIDQTQKKFPFQLFSVSMLLNTTKEEGTIESDKKIFEEYQLLIRTDHQNDIKKKEAKMNNTTNNPLNTTPNQPKKSSEQKINENNKNNDNNKDVINNKDKETNKKGDNKKVDDLDTGFSSTESIIPDNQDKPNNNPPPSPSDNKKSSSQAKNPNDGESSDELSKPLPETLETKDNNKVVTDGTDPDHILPDPNSIKNTEDTTQSTDTTKENDVVDNLEKEINEDIKKTEIIEEKEKKLTKLLENVNKLAEQEEANEESKKDSKTSTKQQTVNTKQKQLGKTTPSKATEKDKTFEYFLHKNAQIEKKNIDKKGKAIFAKQKANKKNYDELLKNKKATFEVVDNSDDPFQRQAKKLKKEEKKKINKPIDPLPKKDLYKNIQQEIDQAEKMQAQMRSKIDPEKTFEKFDQFIENFDWNWIYATKNQVDQHSLVPEPQTFVRNKGKYLRIFSLKSQSFTFAIPKNLPDTVKGAFERLRQRASLLQRTTEVIKNNPMIGRDISDSQKITLRVSPVENIVFPALDDDEGYELLVDSKTKSVEIKARTSTGVLRAISTIYQMLVKCDNKIQLDNECADYLYLAPVKVVDSPSYKWRGLMLDVARRFHPIDCVLRALDGMEIVKLNVLHLHLSDNNAVSVESKRFPLLNSNKDTPYYTQEQITEIVGYAAKRGIRVVPEFSMPSHADAILRAYPFLTVKGFDTADDDAPKENAFNPISKKVYQWIKDLVSEMGDLFPDKYFHIGGDSVAEGAWNSPAIEEWNAQQKSKGDYKTLQNFFEEKVVRILEKFGKTPVGWENVLAPTLPKPVIIQSASSELESINQAVNSGFNSLYSGDFVLNRYEPSGNYLQSSFFRVSNDKMIGAEALVFSENIPADGLDNILWPRLTSFAEKTWNRKTSSDLLPMYKRQLQLSYLLTVAGCQHLSEKLRKMDKFVDKFFSSSDPDAKALLSQHLYVFSTSLVPIEHDRSNFNDGEISLDEFVDILDAESYIFVLYSSLIDFLIESNSKSNDIWWQNKDDPKIQFILHLFSSWKESADYLSQNFQFHPDLMTSIKYISEISRYGLSIINGDSDPTTFATKILSLGNTEFYLCNPIIYQPLISLINVVLSNQ